MPLWKKLPDQLKVLFPDADDKGVFIIPALDSRSQILSVKDRRNGIGKPVFKFVPCGSGQTFTLVASDLSVPGISHEVLQRILSQVNRPELFSAVFSLDGFFDLCHIWFAVFLFVSYYLTLEKVLLVIVIVHAIPCLAFFSLLYGFVAVKRWWCRKLRRRRMLNSHVL